jgi:hypothetical protein
MITSHACCALRLCFKALYSGHGELEQMALQIPQRMIMSRLCCQNAILPLKDDLYRQIGHVQSIKPVSCNPRSQSLTDPQLFRCNKIAEAEAAVSVNEKKWLVVHMHVQLKTSFGAPQTLG